MNVKERAAGGGRSGDELGGGISCLLQSLNILL